MRFNLASLDTLNKVACYNFQLRNRGPQDWTLGFANIAVLYDASAAVLLSDSVQVVPGVDVSYALSDLLDNIISTSGTSLPYENTLGFFRLNITANVNSPGITIPADSTWVSIVNICFQILINDITNPNTCFQMNFFDGPIQNEINIPMDVLNELIFGAPGPDVTRNGVQNLVPDQSFDACFVLEEDTPQLCNDGLDNDEDGLIDCLDGGCNTLCNEDNATTCNDGIDNDSDGLIDCDDDECSPLFQSFTFVEPSNCPDLNNGEIEIAFSANNVEISIDNGVTFFANTIISDLDTGTYYISYRNADTDCTEALSPNPFILLPTEDCTDSTTESTLNRCRDDIDNDNDGLVDCNDSDCRFFDFCRNIADNSGVFIPNAFAPSSTVGNNLFYIQVPNGEIFNVLSYSIFDRYGNKVFDRKNQLSNNPDLLWNGRFNGKELSQGVYVYITQVMIENQVQIFKGDITLLR